MTQIGPISLYQATIAPQSIVFSYNGQMGSLVDCIRVIEESPTRLFLRSFIRGLGLSRSVGFLMKMRWIGQ